MNPTALHIGLDVDGVLSDYMSAVARRGHEQGHQIGGEPLRSYGFVEPGWFPDAAAAAAAIESLRHDGLAELALLDATAPDAVAELRGAGHRVTIVTARTPEPNGRQVLSQWLCRHRIGFDDLRFETAKSRVGCDVYLDDAPHNVAELRIAGHHAVVYDTTYNRHIGGLRVASLSEFAALVHSGQFREPAA